MVDDNDCMEWHHRYCKAFEMDTLEFLLLGLFFFLASSPYLALRHFSLHTVHVFRSISPLSILDPLVA